MFGLCTFSHEQPWGQHNSHSVHTLCSYGLQTWQVHTHQSVLPVLHGATLSAVRLVAQICQQLPNLLSFLISVRWIYDTIYSVYTLCKYGLQTLHAHKYQSVSCLTQHSFSCHQACLLCKSASSYLHIVGLCRVDLQQHNLQWLFANCFYNDNILLASWRCVWSLALLVCFPKASACLASFLSWK